MDTQNARNDGAFAIMYVQKRSAPAVLETPRSAAQVLGALMPPKHNLSPDDKCIPYGYCHCGCGQKTNVHAKNVRTRDIIKGEPQRYINGHQAQKKRLPIIVDGDVVRIPLRSAKYPDLYAIVDAEDAELVSQFQWYPRPGHTSFYAHTTVRNSTPLHRLLTNAKPGDIVDHINHDGLDNRRCNLRVCTLDQNGANRRGAAKSNKCGILGVHIHNQTKRYCASVSIKGKTISLGCFETALEAARIRDRAALELYGEFATLNVPMEGE